MKFVGGKIFCIMSIIPFVKLTMDNKNEPLLRTNISLKQTSNISMPTQPLRPTSIPAFDLLTPLLEMVHSKAKGIINLVDSSSDAITESDVDSDTSEPLTETSKEGLASVICIRIHLLHLPLLSKMKK